MNALAVPILTARAGRINAAHRSAVAAGQSMLAYAVEAGRELIEVKRSLNHGEFGKWCEGNLVFTERQAQRYIKLAKSDVNVGFEELTEAWSRINGNAQPSAIPALDPDTADRILKLARMANGGNENEEAVAQEMLDRLAKRFGMTGEEAEAAARKLCPEPPSHSDKMDEARAWIERVEARLSAVRAELMALHEQVGSTGAFIDKIAEAICVLKFPKEFRNHA